MTPAKYLKNAIRNAIYHHDEHLNCPKKVKEIDWYLIDPNKETMNQDAIECVGAAVTLYIIERNAKAAVKAKGLLRVYNVTDVTIIQYFEDLMTAAEVEVEQHVKELIKELEEDFLGENKYFKMFGIDFNLEGLAFPDMSLINESLDIIMNQIKGVNQRRRDKAGGKR